MWTDQCFAQQQLWSKHIEPEWNTTVVVGGTSHTVAQKCTHTMSGTATHVGNQTFPHMEILRCASSSFYRELFWHSASGSHKPTALQAEKNKPQTNLTPSERHPVTAVTVNVRLTAGTYSLTAENGRRELLPMTALSSWAFLRCKCAPHYGGPAGTSLFLDFCSASGTALQDSSFLPRVPKTRNACDRSDVNTSDSDLPTEAN